MNENTQLAPGEIHVWTIPLSAPDHAVSQVRALLSPDEADRMARFRFEHLQRAYVLSRGALRLLLGIYTGEAPGSLRFSYGPKGKPALASAGPIRFNIAHSGDMGLFAFTLDCELGVDIERVRPVPEISKIATSFFCAREASDLMSLPSRDRERAFFLCWTRKEAYVKAVGNGLFLPLDSFRVTFLPDQPARLMYLTEAWTLQHIEGAEGYVGAIAYKGEPRSLRMRAAPGIAALLTPAPTREN